MLTPSPVPVGDPQKQDVTVVDPAEGGIALVLLGLDLRDVRPQGSAVSLDDLAGPRTAVGAQVRPF
jgi:hypothetical protein